MLKVHSLMVAVGDRISKDQSLLRLEDGFISFDLAAAIDGEIEEVCVELGQELQPNQKLLKVSGEWVYTPEYEISVTSSPESPRTLN